MMSQNRALFNLLFQSLQLNMRNLPKSKLIAYRQCPKRLWLEIHHPDLREDSASTQASFDVGHTVGEIAHQLYDPLEKGAIVVFARAGRLNLSSKFVVGIEGAA